MRAIITDLPDEALDVLFPDNPDDFVFRKKDRTVHQCIGCMSCIFRTPGKCILQDRFSEKAELLRGCSEIVLVSRCVFGSVSPDVKAFLDRMFPVFQGNLELWGEETRFSPAEPRPKRMRVYFYGTEDRRKTAAAENYIRMLAVRWGIEETAVSFFAQAEDLAG